MTIESIIGIVGSVVGILAAGTTLGIWLYNKYKKKSLKELLDKLVDSSSPNECQKILKKMNWWLLLLGFKIKKDYIQRFKPNNKRGKEDLFKEICIENGIYPTGMICEKFLGYDSQKARNEYNDKMNSVKTTVEAPSFTPFLDNEGPTVYVSELLTSRYPNICKDLFKILEKHKTNYSFIKGTNDIWCRDYMPVQTESGKLIQFKYDPSYLKGKKEDEDSRSDVKKVCRLNNIEAQPSDINLDGGNVLICEGRAIISERVFSENKGKDRNELISELSKLLECEIIIIPEIHTDMTGHADGMVRFVNKNTILGNNLAAELKYWQEGMQKVIDEYGLKYIDVPFFEPKDRKHPLSAIGVYVNYLEVNNLIVLPVFGRDEDKQVISILKETFPEKVIETIDYNEIALEGGLLNCTTWVKK
jgi:agmatine/peptidylarginine deiminase